MIKYGKTTTKTLCGVTLHTTTNNTTFLVSLLPF